jgi:hypothetical protein
MGIPIKNLPFSEDIISDRIKIRHFSAETPEEEFKWHWDEEARVIEALNDNDWQFQFDDELPIPLTKGGLIGIPKGLYHRIIKGTTPISIKICSFLE